MQRDALNVTWRHLIPSLMRSRWWLASGAYGVLVFASIAFGAVASAQASTEPLLGTWSGALRHAGDTQPITLRFALDEKKSLVVFLTQPEMKFYNLGPGPVERHGDEYQAPPLTFRLSPDRHAITGTMSFDGNDLTFDLAPGTAPPATAPEAQGGRVARPVWTFKTGGAIWSSPVLDDGIVYFGSTDGAVYAVRGDRGTLVWRTATKGWVMGRPTLNGASLYVLSDDGFLYKLAKHTGHLQWRFDTHGGGVKRDMPNPPTSIAYDYLTSAATVDDSTVYIGSADGTLYAVDGQTGRERWRCETKGIIRSTPAVADGRVFFGSRDNHVYAVDAKTGTVKWTFDTRREVVSLPLVVAGTVYIGSRSSNLYALDAATGAVRWTFFYWTSWVESSARMRDGLLYIGSSDFQQLFALDAASGKKVWSFDTRGSTWSSPAVADKAVYIGAVGIPHLGYIDHHGAFFAVDRSSGRGLWHYPMRPIPGARVYGVASSPAVDRGLVFFGGLDGRFYAFRADG